MVSKECHWEEVPEKGPYSPDGSIVPGSCSHSRGAGALSHLTDADGHDETRDCDDQADDGEDEIHLLLLNGKLIYDHIKRSGESVRGVKTHRLCGY